uniref:Uncharacterized protein n=1 Tax=Arundo donax TaxID=35708 RepID=A0A0A8Z0M0_ARUDO
MDGNGDDGYEREFSFDFANADDPSSEGRNWSSNPRSPSKENHGHEQNDAWKIAMVATTRKCSEALQMMQTVTIHWMSTGT